MAITMKRCSGWLILVLVFAQHAIAQSPTATDSYGKVGYARISGMIDRTQHQYLERTLAAATAQHLNTLIVHIDTDGGEVFYARDLLKLLLD
jgi:membrane-bound ClpP family serine protease